MGSAHVLGALVDLAATAFVGRVLLSVLPPGEPGRHSLRDLPLTWAASHLLGSVALAVEARACRAFDLREDAWTLAAPWLLLLLARWKTLPGAMVPRHDARAEIAGPGARAIGLAALALGAWASFRSAGPAPASRIEAAAGALALLLACAHGLRRARRAPLDRALALLALALLLVAAGGILPAAEAIGAGAGAAFAIPWLRRAERRAAAISAISFAGLALTGGAGALLGAAGLAALCLRSLFPTWNRTGSALLPAPSPPSPRVRIDPPRREVAFLRDLSVASVILSAVAGRMGSIPAAGAALIPLAPAAVLLAGLALARSEEPLASP